MQPIAPMPVAPQSAPAPRELPSWTPEPLGMSTDEFEQISAQARLGVQQKSVDDASRRKKQRLLMACGVAVAVAGGIVFLIERFYDPEARAREEAIALSMQQMAEQQKVTDNLLMIEVDIENAIMNNDLDTARRELAKLVEQKPEHPRREFLQASIDRAAALARLSPQNQNEPSSAAPAQAAVVSSPGSASRPAAQRSRASERAPERPVTRTTERIPPARTAAREPAQSGARTYGAPIGEPPRQPSIPLDAPINSPPTTTTRRSDNSFVGRTLEASDASGMTRPPQAAPTSTAGTSTGSPQAGSAAGPQPSAAAPAPTPPAPIDVVPAKIVKRVTPVAPIGIPRKTAGFVVVKFSIGENGRVADVEVVESTPPGVFDDVAQSAVRKWIYEPRKENGVPVSSQAKARLVFEAAN
jgi:TonB family protein